MGTAATLGWDTVVAFITAAAAAAAAEDWSRSVAVRLLIAFRLLAGVSIIITCTAGSIGGGPDGLSATSVSRVRRAMDCRSVFGMLPWWRMSCAM